MNTMIAEKLARTRSAERGTRNPSDTSPNALLGRGGEGQPPNAMVTPAAAMGPEHHGFLDKRELAELLKITVRTVENWQRRGVIPFLKIGKVVLFHWPDVVEHLRSNFRVCRRNG